MMKTKMTTNNIFVAVMMGSESDLPIMAVCTDTLKSLNISFEMRILSAHRTPDLAAQYVQEAEARGCAVFIAAAGLAAHLAGAIAANTVKPVIGIPMDAGGLRGLDALLSTVQMPGGTPVATVSIGEAGAKNAAILAAEILAIYDNTLRAQLLKLRAEKRAALIKANEALNG